MPKLTHEQYRDMSINQITGYIGEHPSEGFQVAKLYARTSGEAMDIYADYLLQKLKDIAVPSILKNVTSEK